MNQLTHEDISAIVTEGVKNAFTQMGIQADSPIEMQRDFQHLREWRTTMESVRKKSILTLFGALMMGIITLLAIGVKTYTGHGH